MVNAKKIMKKAAGASTGLAIAVAFFNVGLLLTQLVKTVTEDAPKFAADDKPETGE